MPKTKKTVEKQEYLKPKNPKYIPETKEIDATGKVMGRLATEIANILRGKDKVNFVPNIVMGDKVEVINASKMIVTGNKMLQKTYYHHTGYLGHLKSETLKDVFAKNPGEALRRAVYGMLPKNKLRDIFIKNLEINN